MIPVANVRFEPPLGFQTQGGPVWKSEIVRLASGHEVRNGLWAQPLRKWRVSGVPLTEADAGLLVRFFNARSGALQGFRFRDPFGWSTAAAGAAVSPGDVPLGMGDGVTATFQLAVDEGSGQPRTISRPEAASVRVAVDGVETSAFTVDDTTGQVVFDAPPANDTVLTAGFIFDVPVRFETDTLELSQPSAAAFQIVQLALIEVREAV